MRKKSTRPNLEVGLYVCLLLIGSLVFREIHWVARVFVCRVFVCRVFVCRVFVCRVLVCRVFVCRVFVCRVFVCRVFVCIVRFDSYLPDRNYVRVLLAHEPTANIASMLPSRLGDRWCFIL